jgi:branched-chain amino acid transport system permease protein
MLVCGALGYFIELLAYRPLRDQPRLMALITAIGVSMFLEFGGQRIFGATPRAFPPLIPGLDQNPILFSVGSVFVAKTDVIIVACTLIFMTALMYLVNFTRTGRALRAVSFRLDTASLMGININRIISFTFVLGSVLAAVAGVLIAIRTRKVEPLMGLLPGLKAFVAAVLGGIGNVGGAVAGGVLLGLTETLVAGYFPQGSQYRDGVAFVILILVLLVRPAGLFGSAAVEKV